MDHRRTVEGLVGGGPRRARVRPCAGLPLVTVPLVTVLLAAVLLGAGAARAFHEQGVANCDGCHVMHGSEDGQPSPVVVGEVLLRAPSASDLCLMCHAQDEGAVLGLNPLAPPAERGGGNFVFLLEDNLNDADGGSPPIPGAAAGHNIVAPAHGLAADFRYSSSPGGSFPADELGCTSCHDPHGRDTFRMLYGAGPVQGGLATFAAAAPTAAGIDLDGAAEAPDNHTAYGGGMTRWCGNCHGEYHDLGISDLEHPVDETLDQDIRDWYNQYEGDDNPNTGMLATAYLPEVPFEDPQNTATDGRRGLTASSRVSCVTCHRAHASSAPAAGRWDFNVSLLVDDGVASGSWPIPGPYGSATQGSLCRKCHETIPD